MSFFLAATLMQLRRLLRRGATLACLLVAPLLTLALGLALPAASGGDAIRAGVLLPEDAPKARAVWQSLENNSDDGMRFILAKDRAQLDAMVGAGAWECGYVLPEDFDARVAAGQYGRLLIRVESPATTMANSMDWAVSAALLDVCGPAIAEDYLATNGIPAGASVAQEEIFPAGGAMRLEVVPVGAQPAGMDDDLLTGAALVRGMVALLLFLFGCLCAVRFSQDMASGFFSRLGPYAGRARLYFPAWGAAALLAAAAGGLCLAIAGACFSGAFAHPGREALWLALYLLLLAAFSFFLSQVFRRPAGLVGALPFLLVGCLLFCPILIDLTQFLPAGRLPAALLPPTLYLRAAAGQGAALWQMPLAALAYAALGALCGGVRKLSLVKAPA